MHKEARDWVELVREDYPQYFHGRRVLEVGSLDINGTVRDYFRRCEYLGIDLGPGPGVDMVSHVCKLGSGFGPFTTVISCEALEHDEIWYDSLIEMQSLLTRGGLLLVTCAGPDRGVHGLKDFAPECSPYTLHYYKGLTREDIEPLLHFPAVWNCTGVDTQFYMIQGIR